MESAKVEEYLALLALLPEAAQQRCGKSRG
jgi:hypothetical protein